MIIAGNRQVFAIAAELTDTIGCWLLGRFQFVFHGRSCGNWNDHTDLRGCHGWLKEFAAKSRNRIEPGLLMLPAATVFDRLVTPVLAPRGEVAISEYYIDTFSRFHIAHVGMSSFDHIFMVLIEDQESQRCIWGEWGRAVLNDDFFPAQHMQEVAKEFSAALEVAASSRGMAL